MGVDNFLTQLRAIQRFGREAQLKMAIEEMAELQQAICKLWRAAGKDKYAAISHVAEEVADVEIMLEQFRLIFPINNAVNAWKEEKMARLKARLDALDNKDSYSAPATEATEEEN